MVLSTYQVSRKEIKKNNSDPNYSPFCSNFAFPSEQVVDPPIQAQPKDLRRRPCPRPLHGWLSPAQYALLLLTETQAWYSYNPT